MSLFSLFVAVCPVVIVHIVIKAIIRVGARWSSSRASDFRSRGPGFKTTCDRAWNFSVERTVVQNHLCHFNAWATLFTPLCLCLSEETVKAVGPFYLVYVPGEVKTPHREMEKNLLWTLRAGDHILYTTIGVNLWTLPINEVEACPVVISPSLATILCMYRMYDSCRGSSQEPRY